MSKYITKLTVPEEAIPPQGRSDKITFDLQIDMTPFQEMLQGLREAIAQNPNNARAVYDAYQNRIYEVLEETIDNALPCRDRIYALVEEVIDDALPRDWVPEPEPAVPLDPGPGLLHIRRIHPVDERFLEPMYENMYGELLTLCAEVPVADGNDWFVVSVEDVRYI